MANEIYSSSWWGEGVCTNTIDWGSSYKALANCTPSFSNKYSLAFDGVDDRVVVPYNSSLDVASSSHSLSFWLKTTDGSTQVVMEKGRGGELAAFIIGNKIYWGGAYSYYGGTTVVNDGNWHNIIFVADGAYSAIYIDGSSVATKTVALPSTNTDDFVYGTDANGGNAYAGNLDEISIYNYALTSVQVAEIYNSGEPVSLSAYTPVAWYRNGDNGTWASPQWLVPSNINKDKVSNYSFVFDGIDDYINCGVISHLQNATEYSISSWFKSPLNNLYQVIYSWFDGADGYLQLLLVDDGSFYVYNYRTSSAYGVSATGIVSADTWYNALVVFDGGGATNADRLKLYINGSLISLTFTGTVPTQTGAMLHSTMWLGASNSSNFWGLDGNIDEVGIFDSAISIGDVWDGSGKPIDISSVSGLANYYKMGENATYSSFVNTWTVLDAVGSNHGTSANMTIEDRVGDAPNSTSNALSLNMDEVDRETDTP